MSSFTIDGSQFLLDGRPYRILSGAMHYFRIVPEYWGDRLAKMRAMGLNTMETYVAWNMHEPKPGRFRFGGALDLVDYVNRAGDAGLKVIIRPGPYICAECDLGGMPAWLLKDPAMRFRCAHKPFLDAVDRFFDALLPRLAPLQVTRGGPIIAMQVENEYGSYGNDKEYLRYLEEGMKARGIDVVPFTSDGPEDAMLQGGTLPDVFMSVNFGNNAGASWRKLREYQPEGPLDPQAAAAALDELLATGASVNLYMFHGGTNFGFTNGANHKGTYKPAITSYDFDAPLSEAGDPTPKYFAYRDVIRKHAAIPDLPVPEATSKMAAGPVTLTESVALLDSVDILSSPVRRPTPEPMEMLDQSFGFILYRTTVTGPRAEGTLAIRQLHDRAHVFANRRLVGVLEREFPEKTLSLAVPPEGLTLELLVENMGRVNYGPELHDRKGITEGVILVKQLLFGWDIFPLPLDELSGLRFAANSSPVAPAFFRGTFDVKGPADTFLALPGWTKGACWLNGFNLGRYWQRGPQRTLYVPAPLLRNGANTLVVLELEGLGEPTVEFRDRPDLG